MPGCDFHPMPAARIVLYPGDEVAPSQVDLRSGEGSKEGHQIGLFVFDPELGTKVLPVKVHGCS